MAAQRWCAKNARRLACAKLAPARGGRSLHVRSWLRLVGLVKHSSDAVIHAQINEPPEIAMASKRDVDDSYRRLANRLLEGGEYPALATHDEKMIESALDYVRENRIAPERFEFQMLYGIRRDLQKRLVSQGYRLRLYVPYGNAWYPYFMRRLAERPANVFFLARNVIRN